MAFFYPRSVSVFFCLSVRPSSFLQLTTRLFEYTNLVLQGEFWKRQRTMVSPAFHYLRLQEMIPVLVGVANETFDRWSTNIEKKIAEEQKTTGIASAEV